jgi:hypothetical protein
MLNGIAINKTPKIQTYFLMESIFTHPCPNGNFRAITLPLLDIYAAAQRFALLAAGEDSVRDQDSVEAEKIPENAADFQPSSARFVRRG